VAPASAGGFFTHQEPVIPKGGVCPRDLLFLRTIEEQIPRVPEKKQGEVLRFAQNDNVLSFAAACSSRDVQSKTNPRRIPSDTASVRVLAPSLPRIDATWNFTV
jgi:hypothetical protein